MIIKTRYPDYLMHYGRSKDDGAPGVGTGNWDRSGNSGRSSSAVRQEYYRVRRDEASGIFDPAKHKGSPHFHSNWFDYHWKEVIKAPDDKLTYTKPDGTVQEVSLEGPINVAGQIDKDPNFLKDVPEDATYDNNTAAVNPYWGAPGTTHNCVKCTAAQEIRNRGYDVLAGRTYQGTATAAMSYWFDGAVQYKEKGMEGIANRLTKTFGNNGRGEITFLYPGGGGHSVYAYVENGKYVIADGQSSDKIWGNSWKDTLKTAYRVYGFDKNGEFTSTRLDTATPNWKHLEQDSAIRARFDDPSLNQYYSDKVKRYGAFTDFREGSVSNMARLSETLQEPTFVRNADYVHYPHFGPSKFSDDPLPRGDEYYRWRYK